MEATVTPLRAHEPTLSDEQVIALYKHMVFVRALDDRLVALQRDGKIGFHLSSRGEEGTILGAAAALREKDWVFHSGREFGAALWRGMSVAAYLAHVFGSAGDPDKGRQMPGTFASRAARFASVSSPVGTQITHAVGFAWAAKMRRDDVVTLAYFGEGATSSGDFHNGMNFAGVFKTPTVFLCRNNGWATSTPAARQTAASSFHGKGIAYGIPGVVVDGRDLVAVHKAVQGAVLRAARGEGATLIEAVTSSAEHASGNGGDSPRESDPILRVRQLLEGRRAWTEKDDLEHTSRTRVEIDGALAAALRDPLPARETMFDDVYGHLPWHLRDARAGRPKP